MDNLEVKKILIEESLRKSQMSQIFDVVSNDKMVFFRSLQQYKNNKLLLGIILDESAYTTITIFFGKVIDESKKDIIIKLINDIFKSDDIDACYIFGSFLTSRFTEQSDIDIAIVGNIELEDRLYIEGILEEKLNRSIDLVNIEELPKNIQLQIVSRNKKIIFKENENTDRYLYELDTWYKEDYPFWLKLQREMGYEVQ